MNKIILMGRLTKDPEVRYSQNAEPMAISKYTLAVNRRFKREGEPDADFINCVALGKQGEFTEKYLKRGMMIAVSGRLQIRQFDDKNGQRQWYTEVVVEEQDFAESKSSYEQRMGSAPREQAQAPGGKSGQAQQRAPYEPEGFSAIAESIDDDDLPF